MFTLPLEVLREADVTAHGQRVRLAQDMADALAATNPAFDRAQFILACRPHWVVGTRHDGRWERAARS